MTPADADPPAPLDDETAASLCAGVDPLPLPAARRRALFERVLATIFGLPRRDADRRDHDDE